MFNQFLLANLRVRFMRAWVDQNFPIGLDHRCVHCLICIGGVRPAQIKRCAKLKHWQPYLDENGTPSGFHITVATALTNLSRISRGIGTMLGCCRSEPWTSWVSAVTICFFQIVDKPSFSETPNQRSTRAKTFIFPNSQITSERTARLEIKSSKMLIETIFQMETFADNGIWNWPMDATSTTTS